MFISYDKFIRSVYAQRCQNKMLHQIYLKAGGYKDFKRQYIRNVGFGEWLLANRFARLSSFNVYQLAKTFRVYGKRDVSMLPTMISQSVREFDFELPRIPGLLTEEYWSARFYGPLFS